MSIRSLSVIGLCLALPVSAQQGYRLTSRSVDVNTGAHWRAWTSVAELITVSASGAVTPVQLATETNASADASDFSHDIPGNQSDLFDNSFSQDGALLARGGIKLVGTNALRARRVMDGNLSTFWEPDSTDGLDSWWMEIDLGRLVVASRIVLRFAEDDESRRSDPFLQFRVHTANGQNPFGDQSGALNYELAGGTTQPNTDQREFRFDLEPSLTHSASWTGRLVQYVRVQVTGTRGARAEEITEAQREALPAADRGVVEHLWLIAEEERLVTAEEYETLPSQQQGGRRFFRRERPRLAELEVWTVGQNVSLGLLERGGTLIEGNPNAAPELAFDGSIQTNWNANVFSTVGDIAGWGLLVMDLGALLRIDGTRIITRLPVGGTERVIYGYALRGSDGSVAPDGSLIWETLSSDDRLLNQDTRLFADLFESRPLRYLEFHNLDVARRTNAHLGHRFHSAVTELQVYASGYVPEVVMTSDLIDLADSRTLLSIQWEADTPPETAVQIRTRTGNDLREVSRYFLSTGEEVPKAEWDSKPSFFQGPVEVETVPGPGWSNWSQAYLTPGERIRSPSPRRYLMIEARLLSDTPDTAATLRSIRINTLPPVADELAAEITPKHSVPVGELIEFDLYVRPTFTSSSRPGFDLLRLIAPSRAALNLRAVDRGSEAELAAGSADAFTGTEGDSLLLNTSGLELSVEGQGTDSLQVRLPTPTRAGDDLVRLTFFSTVFLSGSTFQLAVANSSADTLWQEADPGDVVGDGLAFGSGLTVLTALGGGSIKLEGSGPGVFTPNNDGQRDTAVFEFVVLRVNVSREVSVELFDLRGRRVRRLVEIRSAATGLYRVEWDGRDGEGHLVPPGLYVARVGVDTDADGTEAVAIVVGVAY